jgi:hypothetical protein
MDDWEKTLQAEIPEENKKCRWLARPITEPSSARST